MKRVYFAVIAVLIILITILVCGCTPSTPAPASPAPSSPAPSPATSGPTKEKPIELTFAHWAAPPAAISRHLWNWWPKMIEEATGGRVHFTINGGASMGPPGEHYQICKSGMADITNISPGFTPGQFPFSEIAGLPMMFPNSEVAACALYRFYEKYTADKEFKDVKVIAACPPGNNQVVSSKPVKTMADFKGMKICATEPLDIKVLQALGASPVSMTRGEVYTSLERKLIDGSLSNPMAMVMFKDMEVTKFRTFDVGLSLNCSYMIMNWDSWNKLPPDIQNIFIGLTGISFSQLSGITFDTCQAQMAQQVLAYDKKVGNPEPYYLPADERAKWIAAVTPVTDAWIKEKEAAGLPAKAAVDDMRKWVEEFSKNFLP